MTTEAQFEGLVGDFEEAVADCVHAGELGSCRHSQSRAALLSAWRGVVEERDRSIASEARLMARQIVESAPKWPPPDKAQARWEAIATLWYLGEVELTTNDEQHFVIIADPAEHLARSFTGDDPDAAADAAVAYLADPTGATNAE